MLDAAWDLFKERGVEAISLNDVIARSGGSRATLYAAFGDKDGLIEACVAENCGAFARMLAELLDDSGEPRETLRRLARELLGHLWRPEAIRIFGSFMVEGRRFPRVIDAFLSNGPRALERRLADYLATATRRGRLAVRDPERAARLFLDALHGDWLLGNLLDPSRHRDPGSTETAAWIDYIVDRVLDCDRHP